MIREIEMGKREKKTEPATSRKGVRWPEIGTERKKRNVGRPPFLFAAYGYGGWKESLGMPWASGWVGGKKK